MTKLYFKQSENIEHPFIFSKEYNSLLFSKGQSFGADVLRVKYTHCVFVPGSNATSWWNCHFHQTVRCFSHERRISTRFVVPLYNVFPFDVIQLTPPPPPPPHTHTQKGEHAFVAVNF